MSTNHPKQTPSLIHPDLSGLWSVARLGYEKAWYSRIAGTIVMSLFLYSWIGGFQIPLLVFILFTMGYYTTAITISTIIIVLYFIPISAQPWICRLYMRYGAAYFDGGTSLCYECEPIIRDPKLPICAGIHPHGLLCNSYFLNCGIRFRAIQDINDKKIRYEFAGRTSELKHLNKRWPYRGLIVGYLVNAPIFNFVITKITGCIASSSNKNLKSMMRTGESFGILPGGFNEATLFRKGENVIYIRKRKGFIKYCLQFGYEIVPGYIFGECETYNNLFYSHTNNSWIMNIKWWLNKNKIPTVFPIGPYWFSPFLPFTNTGLHAIFTSNTRCDKIDNPTQNDIDEYHKWYMNQLNGIFERNKWRFGYDENVKLKIL